MSAATQPATSTPYKRHLSTMMPYTTHARYRIEEIFQMGEEMRDYVVGPMPGQEFLDKFFPTSELEGYAKKVFKEGVFKETIACKNETSAYGPFINSAGNLAPELEFINSSGHVDSSGRTDFSFQVKPDVCVYSKNTEVVRSGPTDMSNVEMVIEFKWKEGDDPFCGGGRQENGPQEATFLRKTKAAADTLGQITAYVSAQLGSQFRTHCYSVLIVKKVARILRWDRSGVIVTTPIEYDAEGELAEFLHRFSKASPAMRGVDETVMTPTVSDASDARKCLNLAEDVRMFEMEVPSLTSDEKLWLIVPAPVAPAYSPPGRSTRGFISYDPVRKKKVYMKDTWRLDIEGIEPEGDTYKLLHEKRVRNIPRCLAGEDVSTARYHATQTHRCGGESSAGSPMSRPNLNPHRHYRLVLDTVGRKLTEFESSRELVRAVRDALDAHSDAFENGVLHRDISAGNMIIADGGGLLIDWDLCKHVSAEQGPRRAMRTGTWQFMSAALVGSESAPHGVEDDLESFLWVLLWVAVMFSPSSMSAEARTVFVNQVFDPKPVGGTGGDVKEMFLFSPVRLWRMEFHDELGKVGRKSLKGLCLALARKFSKRYVLANEDDREPPTHEQLGELFKVALEAEDWPKEDGWKRQQLVTKEDGRKGRYQVTKTDWTVEREAERSVKRQRTDGGGAGDGGEESWSEEGTSGDEEREGELETGWFTVSLREDTPGASDGQSYAGESGDVED